MQQNPRHCEDPANAEVVEEEGDGVSLLQPPAAAGRAGGARGDLRREQRPEIRGARDAPQPPDLPAAPQPGRGGVRLRQLLGAAGDSVRRVAVRGDPPIRLARRLGSPEMLPRRRPERELRSARRRVPAIAVRFQLLIN